MNLTVYTYGYMDAMFYILNGIAMILNSSFADLMIKAVAIVATFYYGLQAAYSGTNGARQSFIKVAGMIVVINVLLIPRTSMFIEDHVSKQRDKVDNIPYGFAIPVGFLEQFGDILTAALEQGFTAVGSSNYRDYGMVFGARLLQEARNWRIKTPEFSYNMDNFIRRCVVYDASIGYKYTINDLFDSGDVWELVRSKASSLRRVEMKVGGVGELKTCKEAADTIIGPAFTTELDRLKTRYIKSDFALAGNLSGLFTPRGTSSARSFFKKNIEEMNSKYLGGSTSAESSLRQFMMINSLSDYGRNYGFSRGAMTQESNWRIAGDLANMYLPILLSVMKGLVYASFIFMVPLMLLSGGMKKYLSYLTIVVSLQLWPALNAILNMFIDTYSASELKDIIGGVVSFSSYSKVGNYSDKIVSVASGIQMVIPYLAFTIMQGGVSGFINLAGNITGASQSAATSAAQEVVSNNKSFDNYSAGNMQVANNSGFKTDWNSSYREGASEWQHMDGTMERILPNGTSVLQSGVGMTMSGGGVKFNDRQAVSSQIANNLSGAQNLLQSEQASFHDAERSTFAKTASFVENLARRESQGESFDYSKAGEEGKTLQRAVDNVKSLRSNYVYSWDQATDMTLRAGSSIPVGGLITGLAGKALDKAGVPNPISSVSKMGVPDISLGAEGRVAMRNASEQRLSDDNETSSSLRTNENYSNIVRAVSNEQFAKSNNIDKSYSDDIRSSYERQQSAERSMNVQADKVDSLSRALSKVQSTDSSHDRDMYDDVQKAVARTYGVSSQEAHRMIESHDPRVDRIWNSMVGSQISKVVGGEMRAAQINFNDTNRFAKLDEAERKYKGQINHDHKSEITQHAANEGIDSSNTNFIKNNVQEKVEDMMTDNSQAYRDAKQENKNTESDLQSKVNKYEEDRIGQGKMSKVLTFGAGVGGPTNPSTSRTKETEKANETAVQVPNKKD